MARFFDRIPYEAAVDVETMSRLVYELRENRKQLLLPYQVDDPAQLLDKIRQGEVAEHPAYEHYLGAVSLEASREALRAQLRDTLLEINS
ncbi:hypothetical protein [Paludibacterium purpuratum]|uniref:Uncharacterized protein n=1 Tax=Paludibacterium purpuratum TaxID=1144873 RepID=A0A4R7BBR0_9NEIS|nr:hypothetical protein [Paludibacterium purpuratum]TDR81532.1 hypothetical protein DFP86_103185 [Paludibacterium purpuratum]